MTGKPFRLSDHVQVIHVVIPPPKPKAAEKGAK